MDPAVVAILQREPFREFLAAKLPADRYNFGSPANCPIAEFLATNDGPRCWVGMATVYSTPAVGGELETPIPEGWTLALAGTNDPHTHDWDSAKWTYGQALARFDAIPAAA